jgi:hypothetical protein
MIHQRNNARQRRQHRRYFNDLSILVNEANWTDDHLLSKRGLPLNQQNAACMSMSIGLTLEMMIRHLDQCVSLELIRQEEVPMHLLQTRYVYMLYAINRRNALGPLVSDVLKFNNLNLESLNEDPISDMWKKKRRRMTPLQRLLCD